MHNSSHTIIIMMLKQYFVATVKYQDDLQILAYTNRKEQVNGKGKILNKFRFFLVNYFGANYIFGLYYAFTFNVY